MAEIGEIVEVAVGVADRQLPGAQAAALEVEGMRHRRGVERGRLGVVGPLLAGEEVTYTGQYYQVEKARIYPLPVQRPHVPVYVGGFVKAAYERAIKYGDGYFGPTEMFPGYLEAVAAAGRDPAKERISLIGTADSWVVVAHDPEKAMAEVAPHFFSKRLRDRVEVGNDGHDRVSRRTAAP